MINDKLIDLFLKTTLKSASVLSGNLAPFFVDYKNISRIKNVPYGSHRDQILDIYFPKQKNNKPLPITILIHGGGFRFFSKDSHATAANALAKSGRLVFSINYRLTPEHPYPAGLIDAITAYSWVIQNAKKYGGDPEQLSLAGESAGANFALALCLHLFGIKTLDTGHPLPEIPEHKPKHAILHCGHLHVSNVDRYIQRKNIHPVVLRRILQVQRDYLPEFQQIPENRAGLADPLIEIESLAKNKQSLPEDFPQLFVPVGGNDPVAGDSIRLGQALEMLGQKNRLKVYEGETHAFYILPFSKKSKECWGDILSFLNNQSLG